MIYEEETLKLLQDEFSGSQSDFMMIDGEEEDEDDMLDVDSEDDILGSDDEEESDEWE